MIEKPDLSGRTAFIAGTTTDTVCEPLSRDPASFTGNAVYDEELLREAGVEDFSAYNVTDGDPMALSAQMFDPEYERPA